MSKVSKTMKILGAGSKGALKRNAVKIIQNELTTGPILEKTALNLFSEHNKFRRFLFKLVMHKRFDLIFIFFIVLSAISLALDSPTKDPASSLKNSLFWIDLGTTIVFVLEAILKIMAFGFVVNGKSSYLR